MALLLETTLGDLVIDLDIEGSPTLCQNVLELAGARYYTQTLIYNIQANRFCQLGDPHGDGTGGACWQGVLDAATTCTANANAQNGGGRGGDVTRSTKRFLKSRGRRLTPLECQEKGRVVATEINGIQDTIGSQFLITIAEGPGMALDGYSVVEEVEAKSGSEAKKRESLDSFLSLGRVTEDDNNVLEQLSNLYCDAEGRPYADVRVKRALVVYNPFKDPPEMTELMRLRGIEWNDDDDDIRNTTVAASPDYERPPEEKVDRRIPADEVALFDDENQEALAKLQEQQAEESMQHETRSRAVVLEMLGDLPSAEIRAPENVLFVCKLNPVTEDEDLELIFSRFDPQVKAEIIRDHDTGSSLQYAFVEFTQKQLAVEAYFKMNNALVDDRRIKVDFSQSVAKIWDRHRQRLRPAALPANLTGGGRGGGRGTEGRGRGRGGRGGRGGYPDNDDRGRRDYHRQNDGNNNNNSNGRNRPDHHTRGSGTASSGGGRGRGYDSYDRGGGRSNDRDRRPSHERDDSSRRRPSVDEFGRARVSEGNNNNNRRPSRSVSPDDRHRSQHRGKRPSRSPSRSRSSSDSRSRRRRSSRSRSRDRGSRKHHKSSKKKKRKHSDDDDRRHRRRLDRSDSPDNNRRKGSKRRYDSDDEGNDDKSEYQQKRNNRRYDSDASDEGERRHRKKHSKHHKHHKRPKRSRSRSP